MATPSHPAALPGPAALSHPGVPGAAPAVVRSGSATTAEGQRFAPYEFTVELDPGTYELVIMEDDLSGGEGRAVISDDRTIIVR